MSVAELTWSQPRAFRRRYELHSANRLVGDLRFSGLFTAKAQATLADHVWDIRSEGFRHNQILVTPAGRDVPEVTFTRHWLWSGGHLDFRERAPLRVRIAWLRRKLLLQTSAGECVLSLRYRGMVRSRGELHLGPRAPTYEPTVLALIAWYLVVTGLFQTKADWTSV